MKKENVDFVIDLIDSNGWSLSAAKAVFKKLTGVNVKSKSKDDFINKIKQMVA